ncbi:MAG: hypothetical protein WBQ64_19140 [Terriglobales bacterium]
MALAIVFPGFSLHSGPDGHSLASIGGHPAHATGNSVRIYRSNGIEVLQEQPYHSWRPLSLVKDLVGKEAAMRQDDTMEKELVSEIVLLTSGIVVVVTLIVAVMVAFARVASVLP